MDDFPWPVLHPGTTTVNELRVKCLLLMEVYLEAQPDLIARGLTGSYAIICPDKKVMLSETEGPALAYIEQFSEDLPIYIGRIGEPKEGWIDL